MLTINLFIESIQDTKSPDTVSGYRYDLIHFERYLKERNEMKKDFNLNDITAEQKIIKKLKRSRYYWIFKISG